MNLLEYLKFKKEARTIPSERINKDVPFVMKKGRWLKLFNSDGIEIPGQLSITVTDDVLEPPTYTLTGVCNIVSNESEMMEIIEKYKTGKV